MPSQSLLTDQGHSDCIDPNGYGIIIDPSQSLLTDQGHSDDDGFEINEGWNEEVAIPPD